MERLHAADYFREALVLLGEQGVEAMTISALCDRLSVTKGSFYHHFGSLSGFVDQLLGYWSDEHSDKLVSSAQVQPDAALRLAALIESAIALPHATEAAIRAWGASRPDVAEVVARVDRLRERHLGAAVAALGVDGARARLLGRMALNLVVGAQQREQDVDRRRLRAMLAEFTGLLD
ncbi:TetR/AcrR family transcriptional regulator [uncultured Jatrophihabitans sp.]|uniref:TetR/AcrR family transcriptional regulator n=1 Tax=uncultured Jatrophihabitans sp. TaxID=1610747 RepID=UPI0035CB04D8